MIEVMKDVRKWIDSGRTPVVVAVLIDMDGSAVRGRGAVMAVNPDGLMTGSVSGGCIESTVLDVSARVFETGKSELIRFCQIDDEILGSVSPCGGEVSVVVGVLDPVLFDSFSMLAVSGRGGKWGVVSSGPGQDDIGSMFVMDSDGVVLEGSFSGMEFQSGIGSGIINDIIGSCKTEIISSGDYEIFSAVLKPAPQLVIVGASHIGIALAKIAGITGYRVIVVDPRAVFARDDRFKNNIELLNIWPRKAFKEIDFTPYTAVAVITHDTKIDDQALRLALAEDCFYLGALGSSSTHRDRVNRLIDEGLSESDCDRIHSPIGLNISSANPEEIAISIMAEVIKDYRDKFGKL